MLGMNEAEADILFATFVRPWIKKCVSWTKKACE
ncbi:MAG: hypothetical protein ACJA1U_000096 [Bermanella sp.]|jgi:hypothetical protein